MKSKKSTNKRVRLDLSGTGAGVNYCIGIPNPFTGLRNCKLESRHLEALKFLMSFATSDRLDDWFMVPEQLFWQMTIAEDEVLDLLVPLLLSWVRTRRPKEAPVVTQFAAIAVLNDPPYRHFDIRICDEMVPVLRTVLADSKLLKAAALKNQLSVKQNQKAYAKKDQKN